MLKIYNSLTRQKEEFIPIQADTVKMYTCGQTVYNHIHVGNARFYVVYDAVRRYLEYCGYNVEFVQNFTDIDDKTIQRALEEGVSCDEIAAKYIASTIDDLAALNVMPATINPRVTMEMPEIIAMVKELIERGVAYENGGTVYFAVNKFADYGKLSKKNIDELAPGARIEVETGKENPLDFVLWKPAKDNEPSWQSPWGNGRPGWHIECSAMIRKYLGDQIDIHGGGQDLVFPHHENEIAQTEAITGKNFANVWMHCGMITVDHKKMSKSRGNFATLKEVAAKYPHDVLRFFFLSGHYRMPMEFTPAALEAAQQGLTRIKNCYSRLVEMAGSTTEESTCPYFADFMRAMSDDFNTADAITAIFELVKHVNTQLAAAPCAQWCAKNLATLNQMLTILGIPMPKAQVLDAEIEALIAARQTARKAKDFAKSDRVRDVLLGMGIVLEDTREGVRWHRA